MIYLPMVSNRCSHNDENRKLLTDFVQDRVWWLGVGLACGGMRFGGCECMGWERCVGTKPLYPNDNPYLWERSGGDEPLESQISPVQKGIIRLTRS